MQQPTEKTLPPIRREDIEAAQAAADAQGVAGHPGTPVILADQDGEGVASAHMHRLGLIAEGTDAEKRAVVAHAPPEFHVAAGELLTKARKNGHLPPEVHMAHDLLTHPDATHADRQAALQHGSGLFNFLGGLAKGVIGGIGSIFSGGRK